MSALQEPMHWRALRTIFMLTELMVQNLVIVERAKLRPEAGLTVISGETGAGKSLLLDALEMLMGGRAQARLVGPRGDSASVSAVFQVDAAIAAEVAAACGVPDDQRQFILRRRISATGRSQGWINDVPVTVAALQAAAQVLVEIRAQHEAQRLGDPAHQRALLDAYAGLGATAADYRAKHERCLALERELAELDHGSRDSLKELEFLRFQSREFTALAPRPGELAELEQRVALLSDVAHWREQAERAADALGEGDRSVVRILGQFARTLSEAPDERLAAAGRGCSQALELVRDAAAACADAAERLVGDPAELQRVQERHTAWYDLMRKHGDGEEALLAAWRAIDERIGQLEGLDERRAKLVREQDEARGDRQTLGDRLAKARAKAFVKLAAAVTAELAELGMPKAKLSLAQEPLAEPSAEGTVRQEFLVSTNPGLPAGRLGAVVSGGEGARLSLALAVVLAEHDRTPVLVFDEVDSGVGGRLGAAIGDKLARLAGGRTVLAVTHTPQVAAAAHRHYAVRKLQGDDETMVDVDELTDQRRLTELADMLGGGAAALGQAKAMMAGARR